eukprot:s2956_g2.t1
MRKARSQSPDAAATLNEWILADLLSLPFENCHFDLILDKGTFDAFEASDAGRRRDEGGPGPAESLCNEVDRVLKRHLDSAWLQITHSAPELRLEADALLNLDETGFEYFVYFVRRRPMFELVRLREGEASQLGIFVDESQALAAASDAAGEHQQQVGRSLVVPTFPAYGTGLDRGLRAFRRLSEFRESLPSQPRMACLDTGKLAEDSKGESSVSLLAPQSACQEIEDPRQATSPSFRLRLMGRGAKAKAQPWRENAQDDKWWAKQEGQGGQGQHGRPWRFWSGAWGSPGQRAKSTQRYDQVQLKDDTPAKETRQELTAASERPVALMQAVQRALTASRKADARMRRLKEEKSKRERQWQQWAEEAKASFFQQKKEFESDIQKLEADMAETAVTGRTAADKVSELVLHGLPQEPVPTAAPAGDDSWDRLIADEPDQGDHGPGFYQEALAASNLLRPTAPRAQATAPVLQIRPEILQQLLLSTGGRISMPDGTPVQLSAPHPGPPYTAPGARGEGSTGPEGLDTATDLLGADPAAPPYGPVGTFKDRRSSPLHPGQRNHADPKAGRENVKEATKTPPGKPAPAKSLQAKLEARRAEEMGNGTAMQPFRVGTAGGALQTGTVSDAPTGSEALIEPPPSAAVSEQIDIDADMPDGTKSPGLDGMG